MIDFLIWFLIGLAVGAGAGALGGVYVSENLKPRQYITYTTQETQSETHQKTEVFQGQITVVLSGGLWTTNINININSFTNLKFFTNITTNFGRTNETK